MYGLFEIEHEFADKLMDFSRNVLNTKIRVKTYIQHEGLIIDNLTSSAGAYALSQAITSNVFLEGLSDYRRITLNCYYVYDMILIIDTDDLTDEEYDLITSFIKYSINK